MYGMFEEHSILVSDENVINDYTLKILELEIRGRFPYQKQHQGKTRGSIAFDISFDVENGPKAAEYIHNAISKWSPLRPWCLTLKILL